jgi:hypothetical protein
VSGHKFSIGDVMEFAEIKVGILGWKAYTWEACGCDSIVTGDIPVGVYKSGKNKDRPKFKGPGRKVIVTKAEMQEKATQYEAETGKCWDCKGTGQTWVGWSKEEGTRYRACLRCGGSGDSTESYSPPQQVTQSSQSNSTVHQPCLLPA